MTDTPTGGPGAAAATIPFVFERGEHRGEAYVARLSVCGNPTCRCSLMWLEGARCGDAAGGVASLPEYRFPLDVVEKRVPRKEAKEIPSRDREFALAVARELDDGHWKTFLMRFLELKAQVIEKSDLDRVEAEFPAGAIEDESLLIPYNAIFPYARQVVLRDGPLVCSVVDQYCVK